MSINLDRDYDLVLSFIKKRVEEYHKSPNIGPGNPNDPIAFIELTYSYEQGGWVGLVFDTRPDANPDGEYTLYLKDDKTIFYMPDTSDALEANFDEEIAADVILADGTRLLLNEEGDIVYKEKPSREYEGDFNEQVGELMRQALEYSYNSGLFNKLPLASPCYYGVEETNGQYAWPIYEEYKTKGRIN